MNSLYTQNKVKELTINLETEEKNTDEIIAELVKIITPDSNGKKTNKKAQGRKGKNAPKKWYDHTCYEMSKRLKNVAKLYANSPTNPHLRGSLCKTRKNI